MVRASILRYLGKSGNALFADAAIPVLAFD